MVRVWVGLAMLVGLVVWGVGALIATVGMPSLWALALPCYVLIALTLTLWPTHRRSGLADMAPRHHRRM